MTHSCDGLRWALPDDGGAADHIPCGEPATRAWVSGLEHGFAVLRFRCPSCQAPDAVHFAARSGISWKAVPLEDAGMYEVMSS